MRNCAKDFSEHATLHDRIFADTERDKKGRKRKETEEKPETQEFEDDVRSHPQNSSSNIVLQAISSDSAYFIRYLSGLFLLS